jgi:hypothetical protein
MKTKSYMPVVAVVLAVLVLAPVLVVVLAVLVLAPVLVVVLAELVLAPVLVVVLAELVVGLLALVPLLLVLLLWAAPNGVAGLPARLSARKPSVASVRAS